MSTFRNPNRPPDIEVELHLKATQDGGRKKPLWQGCRLPHDFGLENELNDGMYRFLEDPPSPGQASRAVVWLLAPERNRKRFYPGLEFRIWEGGFIGTGRILRVFNSELKKSDT